MGSAERRNKKVKENVFTGQKKCSATRKECSIEDTTDAIGIPNTTDTTGIPETNYRPE